MMKDKTTKAFTGSALVRFTNRKQATAAIEALNGKVETRRESSLLTAYWSEST